MRTFNFRVTENLEPDDVLLIDSPGGTRTIKASDAVPSNVSLIENHQTNLKRKVVFIFQLAKKMLKSLISIMRP